MTLTKLCASCGATFEKKPSTSMRVWTEGTKYCSRQCYADHRRNGGRPDISEKISATKTGRAQTPEHRAAISSSLKGRTPKYIPSHAGHKHSEESKALIRQRRRGKATAEANGNWKGGREQFHRERVWAMRQTPYKDWRRQVFERDDFTCQECEHRGGRLHAHHIKAWTDFPELRFDLANGTTLCEGCHRDTHRRAV